MLRPSLTFRVCPASANPTVHCPSSFTVTYVRLSSFYSISVAVYVFGLSVVGGARELDTRVPDALTY